MQKWKPQSVLLRDRLQQCSSHVHNWVGLAWSRPRVPPTRRHDRTFTCARLRNCGLELTILFFLQFSNINIMAQILPMCPYKRILLLPAICKNEQTKWSRPPALKCWVLIRPSTLSFILTCIHTLCAFSLLFFLSEFILHPITSNIMVQPQ